MHSLTTAKLLCLALLQSICGQECGPMGGSFVVNDTVGVITVRGLVDISDETEDRPCYWLFEPFLPHYVIVLRVQNVTGNAPEVSVDDRDRGRKQCIYLSGTCLDKYVYRNQTYHGECISLKSWISSWCMIDQKEETWRRCRDCITESNDFSTKLEANKTYCYNSCTQDIQHANECNEIDRKVDSVLRYGNSKPRDYFEIFYEIIPCQNSFTTSLMSSAPTETNPESKVQTTTVTTFKYQKTTATSLISSAPTETNPTGNRQLTAATSGELSDAVSSETIVSIIVPVLVVVVFILIVGLVTAFIIRKRKTAEEHRKNKKEDVENVLYVAFQGSADDKLEVDNVLYGTT